MELCSLDPVIPNIENGVLFCCVGRTTEGAQVLGLSTSNASVVKVPRALAIKIDENTSWDDFTFMIQLIAEIKALVIINSTPLGSNTLVYGAGPRTAASLQRSGRSDISFVTFKSGSTVPIPHSHIFIERHASRREVQSKLPAKTRTLIHMGHGTETREFTSIKQALPTQTNVFAFTDLITRDVVPYELLAKALAFVGSNSSPEEAPCDQEGVITASTLVAAGMKEHGNAALVDWRGNQNIKLSQKPVDTSTLFSPNKTYILVGLTGQIGQSMCRWMVQCGARHIVVTSRYVTSCFDLAANYSP